MAAEKPSRTSWANIAKKPFNPALVKANNAAQMKQLATQKIDNEKKRIEQITYEKEEASIKKLMAIYSAKMIETQQLCIEEYYKIKNLEKKIYMELLNELEKRNDHIQFDERLNTVKELEQIISVCNIETFQKVQKIISDEQFLKFMKHDAERYSILKSFNTATYNLLQAIKKSKSPNNSDFYSFEEEYFLTPESYVNLKGRTWSEHYAKIAIIINLFIDENNEL
jgi:hypothetical protein